MTSAVESTQSESTSTVETSLIETDATGQGTVEMWTDGACKGNPGLGGWGALLRFGEHEKELFGGEKVTTNNRMELTAVVEALRALKRPSTVIIHVDSSYVMFGM